MKKITIIGTGYVGLVSGAGLAEFGHEVACLDIDENKIKNLNSGKIPIYEPGLENLVRKNVQDKRLAFSSDIEKNIIESKIIFIAVGTPQNENGKADLKAVKSVVDLVANNLNNYKIICTKSTVPVGTGKWIESQIKSINPNLDFDYVSNPEFLREGAAVNDFLSPDRVIIGSRTQKAFNEMKEVYRPLYINETPILNTSIETAEMIKYASNSFLALKISYINEIANLCEEVGADVHQVAKAMGQDGRISSKFLHPGPGFGGSCFPKDIEALYALGKEKNIELNTIDATIKTNKNQKKRILNKLLRLLNNQVTGKKIAVLGLSFKPNTDDIRESPSIYIISELSKLGAVVDAYDPVAIENFKSMHQNINYSGTWKECVKDADACIVLTEWNEFRGMDLNELKSLLKTPILIDAKNIFSIEKLKSLKFNYDNVGRNFS
ncbi:MAG: UDP-glucose/GDP-mannose dehydrogenase family protein [Candidatus Neomarinimicrobiota bacterium]|nr:UDP-glucose/GDP-mannose dehydrogenase family protein [Candidatus Neomarinimicrobiota bacterium]